MTVLHTQSIQVVLSGLFPCLSPLWTLVRILPQTGAFRLAQWFLSLPFTSVDPVRILDRSLQVWLSGFFPCLSPLWTRFESWPCMWVYSDYVCFPCLGFFHIYIMQIHVHFSRYYVVFMNSIQEYIYFHSLVKE